MYFEQCIFACFQLLVVQPDMCALLAQCSLTANLSINRLVVAPVAKTLVDVEVTPFSEHVRNWPLAFLVSGQNWRETKNAI